MAPRSSGADESPLGRLKLIRDIWGGEHLLDTVGDLIGLLIITDREITDREIVGMHVTIQNYTPVNFI